MGYSGARHKTRERQEKIVLGSNQLFLHCVKGSVVFLIHGGQEPRRVHFVR